MAFKVVAFQFSGAGSLNWTADDDYLFTGINSSTSVANTVAVTTDPSLTAALIAGPSATRVIYDLLAINTPQNKSGLPFRVPVLKDTTLIVLASAVTTAVLYFEPLPS